jgi:hypothetical protein
MHQEIESEPKVVNLGQPEVFEGIYIAAFSSFGKYFQNGCGSGS